MLEVLIVLASLFQALAETMLLSDLDQDTVRIVQPSNLTMLANNCYALSSTFLTG